MLSDLKETGFAHFGLKSEDQPAQKYKNASPRFHSLFIQARSILGIIERSQSRKAKEEF